MIATPKLEGKTMISSIFSVKNFFESLIILNYLEGGLALIVGSFIGIGNFNPFDYFADNRNEQKTNQKHAKQNVNTMTKKEQQTTLIDLKDKKMKDGIFVILIGFLLYLIGIAIDLMLVHVFPA